jgi:hypothetical protein
MDQHGGQGDAAVMEIDACQERPQLLNCHRNLIKISALPSYYSTA